jgi:hypothetical protein
MATRRNIQEDSILSNEVFIKCFICGSVCLVSPAIVARLPSIAVLSLHCTSLESSYSSVQTLATEGLQEYQQTSAAESKEQIPDDGSLS